MTKKDLDINSQLSFVMYACSKEIIKHYKPHLDKYDLTYTQYLTLLVLWQEDHLHLNELSEKLYLDSGTMTPMINRLEKKGLIIKTKSEVDKRSVFINVSEKGRSLNKKLKNLSELILAESGFSNEDSQPVLDILNSILKQVNERRR